MIVYLESLNRALFFALNAVRLKIIGESDAAPTIARSECFRRARLVSGEQPPQDQSSGGAETGVYLLKRQQKADTESFAGEASMAHSANKPSKIR